MGLLSLIKKADFLASQPSLRVENDYYYRTFIGGLISISLIAVSFTGIVYFGQELWEKKIPTVVVSTIDNETFDPININENEYYVTFTLEYANYTYYNDPKTFQVSALNYKFKRFANGSQEYNTTELEIKTCQKYFKNYTDFAPGRTLDLEKYWCLKPNQTSIYGYWGANSTSSVRILIKKCINSTENENMCHPKEKIEENIQNGILSMYVATNLIDGKNYNDPVKHFMSNPWNALNVDLAFNMAVNLQKLEFVTDIGYLLEDFKRIRTFTIEEPRYIYFKTNGDTIAEIYTEGVKLGQKVSRNYAKVQDVVTRIGGLLKAFLVIAQLISKVTSDIEYLNDKIFNIEYRREVKDSERKSCKSILQNLNNIEAKDDNIKEENSRNPSKNLILNENVEHNLHSINKAFSFVHGLRNNDTPNNNGRIALNELQHNKFESFSKLKNRIHSQDLQNNLEKDKLGITSIAFTNEKYPKLTQFHNFLVTIFCQCKPSNTLITKRIALNKKFAKLFSIENLMEEIFQIHHMKFVLKEKLLNSNEAKILLSDSFLEEVYISSYLDSN